MSPAALFLQEVNLIQCDQSDSANVAVTEELQSTAQIYNNIFIMFTDLYFNVTALPSTELYIQIFIEGIYEITYLLVTYIIQEYSHL